MHIQEPFTTNGLVWGLNATEISSSTHVPGILCLCLTEEKQTTLTFRANIWCEYVHIYIHSIMHTFKHEKHHKYHIYVCEY